MIEEDKVKLMTRLAAYEKGTGKESVEIAKYFRSDYIASQLLKSFICGTICFLAVIGVWGFYNFEAFLSGMLFADLLEFAKKMVKVYAICLGLYLVVTYMVATYRFSKSKRRVRAYNSALNILIRYYDEP